MRLFETALQKLARIMSTQYGVEVKFEGKGAYTDGKTIVLPSTENLSEELIKDLHGYVDHEVAHIRHTNFDVLSEYFEGRKVNEGMLFHKNLLNGCEDVRINRLMYKDYPGTVLNIEPLIEKHSKIWFERWGETNPVMQLIFCVMQKMLGKPHPEVSPELGSMLDLVEPEIAKLNDCTSTEELAKLTKKIVDKIIEEQKEREEKQDKSDDGDGEKQDSDDDSEGEGDASSDSSDDNSDSDSSDASDGDNNDGDDDSDSDAESGEGSDERDQDESESAKSESAKSESAKSGEDGAGDSDRRLSSEVMKAKPGSDEAASYEDLPSSIDEMIEDAVKDELGDQKDDKPKKSNWHYRTVNKPHIPYSTKYDETENLSGKGDHRRYMKIKASVNSMVAPIRRAFEKSLKAKEKKKWKFERERGQISSRHLYKLHDKNYRKPFRTMQKKEVNNVAVEMLIDLSGSMSGSRIDVAQKSAIAMAEALNDIGITFEVTGFHSEYDHRIGARGVTADYNRRSEAMRYKVYKSFDAISLNGLERISVGQQNPDGEAVKWAAQRLSLRNQPRKILLVLSDGQPCTSEGNMSVLNNDLKQAVKKIEKKTDIEVIAIGIQTDSVKHFYNNYVIVDDLKKLPTTVLSKLTRMILKAS
jgi:cobalamin biosynthesis protein CobT